MRGRDGLMLLLATPVKHLHFLLHLSSMHTGSAQADQIGAPNSLHWRLATGDCLDALAKCCQVKDETGESEGAIQQAAVEVVAL